MTIGLGRRRRWLSLNLPTTDEPYVGVRGAVPFVEGLLPEGDTVRSLVAERLSVDADDDQALLAAIGRDAAGAVAVAPQGQPSASGEAALQPIEADDFGGVETLVVERFDRVARDGRRIERLRQEDTAGALGVRPRDKYLTNAETGVTYQRIAGLLDAFASQEDLRHLARLVTANVALGNADAHGRNYGLVPDPDGTVRLAPAYDVVSTLAYGITAHAIAVDGAQQHERLSTRRLLDEITTWGLPAREAETLVRDTLARLAEAVEPAREGTPNLADRVLRRVRANLTGPFAADADVAAQAQPASSPRRHGRRSRPEPHDATAPACGAWMPRARTACRRRPGHAGPHRRT